MLYLYIYIAGIISAVLAGWRCQKSVTGRYTIGGFDLFIALLGGALWPVVLILVLFPDRPREE